jgi:hypothetical protein
MDTARLPPPLDEREQDGVRGRRRLTRRDTVRSPRSQSRKDGAVVWSASALAGLRSPRAKVWPGGCAYWPQRRKLPRKPWRARWRREKSGDPSRTRQAGGAPQSSAKPRERGGCERLLVGLGETGMEGDRGPHNLRG